MPIQSSVEKKWVWDQYQMKLVQRSEVRVWIETNAGTRLFETGPLYCETGQEIFWAFQNLKERLIQQATST